MSEDNAESSKGSEHADAALAALNAMPRSSASPKSWRSSRGHTHGIRYSRFHSRTCHTLRIGTPQESKESEAVSYTLNGTSSTYFLVQILDIEIILESGCAVNMLSGLIHCLEIGNADHETQL